MRHVRMASILGNLCASLGASSPLRLPNWKAVFALAGVVASVGCTASRDLRSESQRQSVANRTDTSGQLADPSLAKTLQSKLAAREYWASETEHGLQAPNRAHDLRSYFDETGVRVEDRDAPERTSLISLTLVRLGRDGALADVPAGRVLDRGDGRVEISREKLGLVEWFDNSSAGLEQGFTLSEPPTRTKPGIDLPVVLELAVDGARAVSREDSILVDSAAGRALQYGQLVVEDAAGERLLANFEVPSPDRIRILVDDRDATYPIVVDPLLTGAFDAVVESNQASAQFGVSVASAGDVDRDGYDDVIVGAATYDQGQTDEGAAFVFRGGPMGIGNGNPATAHAVLQGDQVGGNFGTSVASAGDVNGDGYADVIVGALEFDAIQPGEGVAFVYHGSAAGIASGGPGIANGTMESNQNDARLGVSVASAGDVNGDGYGDVIVGAYAYDNGQTDEGAAFVLLGSATGIGIRNPTNAHARFEGDQVSAWLGYSVASAGDVNGDGYSDVIAGVPFIDYPALDEGLALIYLGSAAGIASGNPASANTRFYGNSSSRTGESVAGAGDINGDGFGDVIIGSPFYSQGQPNEGVAFVFHGSTALVSGQTYNVLDANQILESNQAQSRYGTSVASAGDVNGDGYGDVIVGAYAYDSGQNDEGVAFVYAGSATGLARGYGFSFQYDQADAFLGYSVASAGDVNGDGYDDVIAGAYLANGGQADEGAAFVYQGGPSGERYWGVAEDTGLSISLLPPAIQVRLLDTILQSDFVFAPAGDVNGDGYGDAIIGIAQYDGAQVDSGAVFVVHGTATGLKSTASQSLADTQLFGSQTGEYFGFSVASAGDVNGDGYGDVIVASRSHSAGESGEGAAFVFLGSANGIASGNTASAHARLETNQIGARINHVAAAGDVNGDGYGDVLVSSDSYDAGTADEGSVFVFLGSAAGIPNGNPSTAHARFETDQSLAGVRATSAGDLNGDGFGDVVVHSEFYDAPETDEGAAFVLLGSSAGIANANPAAAHARFETNQAGSGLRSRTYSSGDVNGDGFADLVLSVPFYSDGESAEGGVYVFKGSASGMSNGNPTSADTRIQSNLVDANLGFARMNSEPGPFDTNADGYADIVVMSLVGGRSYYIYHGSAGGIPNGDLNTANSTLAPPTFHLYVPGADFNGDGHGDLFDFSGSAVQGEVIPGQPEIFWVSMGLRSASSNEGGRLTRTQQRRGDGSGILVSPGGNSQASQFVAELFARSPRGREYGKIEVEYCPGPSATFGQPSCQRVLSPSWADLGTSGVVLSRTVSGLVQGTSYIWRARARYAPYRPSLPGPTVDGIAGPWFRVQGRPRATDIRIATPEPNGGIALAIGGLTIAMLMKRRRMRALRSANRDWSESAHEPGSRRHCAAFRASSTSHPAKGMAALVLGVVVAAVGCVASRDLGSDSQQRSVADSADASGQFADPSLAKTLQSQLTAREYWASETEHGLQAPNRAHDLRTYFDADGVRVEDRDAGERTPLVGLSLIRIGRDGALADVPAGRVLDRGEGRIEITREKLGLVEWFDNSRAGLEQGFTLSKPPARAKPGIDLSVVLELAVQGARAAHREDSILLESATGRTLQYGQLVVKDAAGELLVARFDVPRPDRIRILVDDRDATYPIVVDPLLTGAFDAAVESNQASSEFGVSVASAGDVNADGYDDVIVGADAYDQGQNDEGAAFVFLGGPTGIGNGNPATAHAVLQGDQIDGRFGVGVASAGDVNGDGYSDLIVGAYLFNAGQTDEGAAFVYHGSAAGIESGGPTVANGTMESNQTSAQLGLSVASAGDINADGYADVIVGAFLYDAGQNNEGAAFVLLGSATGIGNRNPSNAHARFEGDQVDTWLGYSVASAGDVDGDGDADMIVGAPFIDFLSVDEGVGLVYLGSPAGVVSGNPASAHARFYGSNSSRTGTSVAGAGDVDGDGYGDVIIGSPFHTQGQTNEGAAFVFHGSALGFEAGTYLPNNADRVLEGNQAESRYGWSAVSAGDVNGDGYGDVIVGAHGYDSGQNNEGVVYVYGGSATGVISAHLASFQYDQADALFGYSVASAGDVNGDGFDDVIAGAYLANGGQSDEGAALVYHGGAAGITAVSADDANAAFAASSSANFAGFTARSAGDLDGDGFSDLVVGVPSYDAGLPQQGAVYIYRGSAGGINPFASPVVLTGGQAQARFGLSAAGAGDVNRDGYDDLIVGAFLFDAGETDEGTAYVFHGSPTGIAPGDASTAVTRLEANQVGAGFGARVAGAGDVNADGFDDVMVVSAYFDAGQLNEGAVFVFLGSETGVANGSPANAATRLESDQAGGVSLVPSDFGRVQGAEAAGDVNGDGYGDLLVFSTNYDAGQVNEGAAFVFLGGPLGIASGSFATAHARFETNQAGTTDGLGFPVGTLSYAAPAGDVDGDGFDDIVVGTDRYSNGESLEGAALVYRGSSSGMTSGDPTTAATRIEGNLANARAGTRVSSAGDVNGDGYGDILVSGLSGFGTGNTAYAFVFHGSSSGIAATSFFTQFAAQIVFPSASPFDFVSVFGLAPGGDFNGDGFADVVVGQLHLSPPSPSVSETDYVFLGNSKGRPKLARQRRGDGSGLRVHPGGIASAVDRLDVDLFVASPRGRERAKLEVEACPSVPIGNPACVRQTTSTWVDLESAGGASIPISLTGLTANQRYSWRARAVFAGSSSTQPGITPIVRKGPWTRMRDRTTAWDIRTVPEPGITAALMAGAIFVNRLGRRRRARLHGPRGAERASIDPSARSARAKSLPIGSA